MYNNIAVIGASGAIGEAMIKQLLLSTDATIHCFSRTPQTLSSLPQHHPNGLRIHAIDYDDEQSLVDSAAVASRCMPLDLVFVSIGILHEKNLMPEKALSQLSEEKFSRLFHINTVIPALVGKHFIPKLNGQHRSIFSVLSARIGSISDNRLGGWYAYRASKAALNMIIKSMAIETQRQNKQAIIVALHPGTVDSNLSKPFQSSLPLGQLLTPEYAASQLLNTIDQLKHRDSGKLFAFDGEKIQP